MRIFGIDLPRESPGASAAESTLVLLTEESGVVAQVERATSLPELAAHLGQLAGGEPFLLGVNIPIVVPARASRSRPVENFVGKRFGFRMPAGGRAAESPLLSGDALLAGLAAAGLPCLPYPDRDRRQSGLAETYPRLILKVLLWQASSLATAREQADRQELFRAYAAPPYRSADVPARTAWAKRAVALDLVLTMLDPVAGFDVDVARRKLVEAHSVEGVERVGAVLDASLLAGMARRYLEAPETCMFVGQRENGYVILPADDFVRELASEARPRHGRLFPEASLKDRLGSQVKVRPVDLVNMPGRATRVEAKFKEQPRYEFDNLDEMLWWKHTRHVSGPLLPVEGLAELIVVLVRSGDEESSSLRLVRSRHRTLSFRFDPPVAWRARVPTRDGKTYPFRVLRAVYETLR